MSTYDPALLRMEALRGDASLPFRLGYSVLGAASATSRDIPIASVSITSGYGVEQLGELSLDPIAASGTLATLGTGEPDPLTPLLAVGNFVQVRYGSTVLFRGVVNTITSALEADPPGWTKRVTYTLLSQDAVLLGRTVSWRRALPAEGALRRLRRFFTVDTSGLPAARRALLDEPMAAQPAGGHATLLEVARAFTARTLLPLIGLASGTRYLAVVDWCQWWDWEAPTATSPATAFAPSWAHSGSYSTKPRFSSLLLSAPDTADIDPAPPTRPPAPGPDATTAPTSAWTDKGDRAEPRLGSIERTYWTDGPIGWTAAEHFEESSHPDWTAPNTYEGNGASDYPGGYIGGVPLNGLYAMGRSSSYDTPYGEYRSREIRRVAAWYPIPVGAMKAEALAHVAEYASYYGWDIELTSAVLTIGVYGHSIKRQAAPWWAAWQYAPATLDGGGTGRVVISPTPATAEAQAAFSIDGFDPPPPHMDLPAVSLLPFARQAGTETLWSGPLHTLPQRYESGEPMHPTVRVVRTLSDAELSQQSIVLHLNVDEPPAPAGLDATPGHTLTTEHMLQIHCQVKFSFAY